MEKLKNTRRYIVTSDRAMGGYSDDDYFRRWYILEALYTSCIYIAYIYTYSKLRVPVRLVSGDFISAAWRVNGTVRSLGGRRYLYLYILHYVVV